MKTFEQFSQHDKEFEEYVASMCVEAGWHIKKNLPDKQFVDFMYSDRFYPIIAYTFYFDESSDEEFKEQLDKFMVKLNIKYTTEYGGSWQLNYDDDDKTYLIVKFNIRFDLVKQFGELNLSTTKYNL